MFKVGKWYDQFKLAVTLLEAGHSSVEADASMIGSRVGIRQFEPTECWGAHRKSLRLRFANLYWVTFAKTLTRE